MPPPCFLQCRCVQLCVIEAGWDLSVGGGQVPRGSPFCRLPREDEMKMEMKMKMKMKMKAGCSF